MSDWMNEGVDLVRRHLPEELAEPYIKLLRPALGLSEQVQGPLVGQLGGLPVLPHDVEWPTSDLRDGGRDPLAFLASIDLSLLPQGVLDIKLPGSGTLCFFYDDEHAHNGGGLLDEPPNGPGGAPVLFVPSGTPVRERPAPAGVIPFRRVPLRAEPIVTDPDCQHSAIDGAFGKQDLLIHPVLSHNEAYRQTRWEQRQQYAVQLGGYAFAWQQCPEFYFEKQLDPNGSTGPGDTGTLLAQFFSSKLDFVMPEGHEAFTLSEGVLCWLIRPSRLAATDFRATGFHFQR